MGLQANYMMIGEEELDSIVNLVLNEILDFISY